MYCAYQIGSVKFENAGEWLAHGEELEAENNDRIRGSLESLMTPTGEFDAAKMMGEWFSDEPAHVFISHSRADKKFALTLAGWLSDELGLTSFVDSCAWGHCNKLLRQIDEECCYQEESNTFSYARRNVTTAHVHLMLSAALTQMLDQCECVFFLRTPNSLGPISISDMTSLRDEHITQSPWLFYEMSMLRLLRRREIEEHRRLIKKAEFSEAKARTPVVNYPIDLGDVPILGGEDLGQWANEWQLADNENLDALDFLYGVKPPHGMRTIAG